MGRISEVVERAINIAERVRESEPDRLETAVSYLIELRKEIQAQAPDHTALQNLELYLQKFDLP